MENRKKYVLGIDVGTTGTKTAALGEDGKIAAVGYKGYGVFTSPEGYSTQNADDWVDAVIRTVREVLEKLGGAEISGISLSTQGATQVCVGADGCALEPAITWMDVRSVQQCKRLDSALGQDAMYSKTGWQTDVTCDAPKIMWIKENRPGLFSRTAKFLSTIEYVNLFLCGKAVVDPTNAAIRELYNINTMSYDAEILSAVGVDESRLPETGLTGNFIGGLTEKAAELLGLPVGVPVYLGAHDQYCASVGCGALRAGDMLLSTGTAWVLLGITDRLVFCPSHIVPGIHPVKGLYGGMASLGGVGNALKWVKDAFAAEYSDLDRGAAERMESAKDVFFYPFFSGSCFPTYDAARSGEIKGLRLCHDKYDIALALMEGVAFEVRRALESYKAEGIDISSLKIMGGASRSDLWCELVGYITGCEITRMTQAEACALGAARIAAHSCGMTDGWAGEDAGIRLALTDDARRAHYERKYELYNM